MGGDGQPGFGSCGATVVDENGALLYHQNLEPGLNGFWVEAKDLHVGDVFLGADGELSTLTNIVRVDQSGGIAVFNFEVEGNHNYFILAKDYDYDQSCVLVHNSCPQARTIDELLNDSGTILTKPPKRGNAAIYQRPGGAQGAINDFNSLQPTNIKQYPNGTTAGILSDGTHIDLHTSTTPGSTQGAATLGIQSKPNSGKNK